jgi:hypothetical protein
MHNLNRVFAIFCVTSGLCASIMMTPEEVGVINSIAPEETLAEIVEMNDPDNLNITLVPDILFLSAILYFEPSQWTVWINDKTYTASDADDDLLKVSNVTKDSIELELKDYLKKSTKVRANQSLVISGRRVIDGDARIKPKSAQL